MSAANEHPLPCFACLRAVIYSSEAMEGKCTKNNGGENCDHCPLGLDCGPVPPCLVHIVKSLRNVEWHREAFEGLKKTLRSSVEAWNLEVYQGRGPMHDTNVLIECCQATMGEDAIDRLFAEPLMLNAALNAMSIARNEGSGKRKFELE